MENCTREGKVVGVPYSGPSSPFLCSQDRGNVGELSELKVILVINGFSNPEEALLHRDGRKVCFLEKEVRETKIWRMTASSRRLMSTQPNS